MSACDREYSQTVISLCWIDLLEQSHMAPLMKTIAVRRRAVFDLSIWRVVHKPLSGLIQNEFDLTARISSRPFDCLLRHFVVYVDT